MNGDWRLVIDDRASSDIGYLCSFTL